MKALIYPSVFIFACTQAFAQLIDLQVSTNADVLINNTGLVLDGDMVTGAQITSRATFDPSAVTLEFQTTEAMEVSRYYSGAVSLGVRSSSYGTLPASALMGFHITDTASYVKFGADFGSLPNYNPQGSILGSGLDGVSEVIFGLDPKFVRARSWLSFQFSDYAGEFDKLDELEGKVFGGSNFWEALNDASVESSHIYMREGPDEAETVFQFANTYSKSFRASLTTGGMPIPEPSTFGLFGAGFLALLVASVKLRNWLP